ncbi:LysR-family transcriptional regulator [Vibrio maritimus]|uniref:LysR-family transcriptional regulator n=1 Tax=Vibrio maritimus TaxID=990268 RepID=A0A090RXJ6_9VIBR|nr:LysR-family transcriptional regulator [Vibrio maritimus]
MLYSDPIDLLIRGAREPATAGSLLRHYAAGTVSGAAKNLHVSQPNITRVLAHTEQQLGFSLFERVKGRLVPTQEAHRLLPDVEKIYRQLGEFQTLTEKVRSGHQHIRIGAPPILASKLLPPIVTKVNQQYGYSIDLMTGNHSELCQALLTNELDIAITFGEETPAGISHERLIRETMRVLLPKDHLSHNPEQDSSISLSAVLAADIGIIALDDRDPLGVRLAAAIRAINLISMLHSLFVATTQALSLPSLAQVLLS